MSAASTAVKIAAPAASVWQVLTTVDGHPGWNPDLRLSGGTEVGQVLKIMVVRRRPGGRTRPFVLSGDVTASDPPRRLAWEVALVPYRSGTSRRHSPSQPGRPHGPDTHPEGAYPPIAAATRDAVRLATCLIGSSLKCA